MEDSIALLAVCTPFPAGSPGGGYDGIDILPTCEVTASTVASPPPAPPPPPPTVPTDLLNPSFNSPAVL
eukprot:CAMPEP_0184416222 /NCGR_PEP_ID=MMETSP0738-20130409/9326_1 /TAXON_ID=385413 /ORGANISM="Thalassiosira miniscula, Strain CCMP1093" /LENGTH=68 /DNA_ID=CAMNT_0026775623 /DNA_START=121 /DNA_END=323 /DNA_ORIENTATION=+